MANNLHLVTGYAGLEHITAADQASLYAVLFGSGQYVLPVGNKLAASVITNNKVRVLDGDILMQGRHIRLNEGSYVDLTIENGTQDMLRNDLIVVRYTKDASTGVESANLVVIKGTAVKSNPADPAYTVGDLLTDHDIQNDMPLYRVPLNGLNVQKLVPLFTVGADQIQTVVNHAKNTSNPHKVTATQVGAFGTSGNIAMDNADPVVYPTAKSNATRLRLYSGRQADYSGGAGLILTNKDAATDAGVFTMTAHDGANSAALVGKPDGTMTWKGNPVYHKGNKPTLEEIWAFGALNKSIPSGDDLNNYLVQGAYYITGTNASEIANMPRNTAMHLYVFRADTQTGASDTKRTLQIATPSGIPDAYSEMYYRKRSESGWSAWKTFATTDYAVNKAGDTMTGDLFVNGGSGRIASGNNVCQIECRTTVGSTTDRRVLAVGNSKNGTIAKAVRLTDVAADGSTKTYDILHTGNLAANNVGRIVVGSYVGTGTAGANNPNSLTFNEAPIWVKIYQEGKYSDIETDTGVRIWGGLTFTLTESYDSSQEWFGFRDSSHFFAEGCAKKSADGKTISWYMDASSYNIEEVPMESRASAQANASGVTYKYIAVFA